MASTEQPRFNGIREYNDNHIIDRYVNLIPMGNLCVDRLGCDRLGIDADFEDIPSKGEFVASDGAVYIVKSNGFWTLLIKYHNKAFSYTEIGIPDEVLTDKVSFVESTVAPQRIYILLKYNTVNHLCSISSTNLSDMQVISPLPGYEEGDRVDGDFVPTLNRAPLFTSISWYDNRLVLTDTNNNVVWLSSTDFQERLNVDAVSSGYRVDGRWGEKGSDQAFPNWYASTNNSDKLNAVIGFGGQLYMMFSRTIERWVRTGIEDAPIQFNTNGTVTVGGSSPITINDKLYFIGNDQLGNQFVGRFTQGGEFQRVSNNAIEKLIGNRIVDIDLLLQRQSSFCIITILNKYKLCFGDGGWWEYTITDDEYPMHSLFGTLAITNKGNLCNFTEKHRRNINGKSFGRYIREFMETGSIQRKRIHAIQVTCDTGTYVGEDRGDTEDEYNSMFCRISTDRGMTYGRYYYRRFGQVGDNNKIMLFRNLGSCNNLVYEIGTAADMKFQLFDIFAELK